MIDLQSETKKFFEEMGYYTADGKNNEVAYCKYNTFKSGADSWFSNKEARQITKEVLVRETKTIVDFMDTCRAFDTGELIIRDYRGKTFEGWKQQLKELEEMRNDG